MRKSYAYMDGTLRKDKSKYFYYYYELEPKIKGIDENGKVIYGKRERRSKSTKCTTITDAKKWVKANYHLFNENKEKKNKLNRNFKFLILKYIKNRKNKLKETTYDEYQRIIEKYILIFFKDQISIDKIEPDLINEYYNYLFTDGGRREKGLSGNTIRRHHAILHHFFDKMVVKKILNVNPCKNIELPKVKKFQNKTFSQKEINELLEVINGENIETALYIALLGLRRGEILGLEWKHIDFEENIMHIMQTRVVTKRNNSGEKSDVKKTSSFRSLSIPKKIMNQIKKEKKRQKYLEKKFGKSYRKNNFICCYTDGRPLRPDYLTKKFKRILEKNNLKVIRLHDLRHSVSTQLINNDVPMKTVSDILGHSNISTTIDIYTHTVDASKRRVASLQDKLFGEEE